MMSLSSTRLNAICPYFTMFRLDFPLRVLHSRASPGDLVFDPFSGRGTTNYAARLLGLPSVGIDSNPVAVALTKAKLANTTADEVTAVADEIMSDCGAGPDVPAGEFWQWAFHHDVLSVLCKLRHALVQDCSSDARKALRAIILGALHGPLAKGAPSYFSNQCTRTYAPKPAYAVRFWKARDLRPPLVDVNKIIHMRAKRYYEHQQSAVGFAISGDSRMKSTYTAIPSREVKWIITSPPFYGMRTYIPDQWLRNWFVGGPSGVDYSNNNQLQHSSPEDFAMQLRAVWHNVAYVSAPDARLVIRFGGISDRSADSLEILRSSLRESPWTLHTVKAAGSAEHGKRQSEHFARTRFAARPEHDAWAYLR
jgi:DNA methylase